LDDLARKIELLKTSLAAAWSCLARSSTSAADKRELRAQARRCSGELRRCLLIAAARQTREHARALTVHARRTLPRPDLRFLSAEAASETGERAVNRL